MYTLIIELRIKISQSIFKDSSKTSNSQNLISGETSLSAADLMFSNKQEGYQSAAKIASIQESKRTMTVAARWANKISQQHVQLTSRRKSVPLLGVRQKRFSVLLVICQFPLAVTGWNALRVTVLISLSDSLCSLPSQQSLILLDWYIEPSYLYRPHILCKSIKP